MALNLHAIRHAQALAKHGNFRRAARALHVSQPTLSRNIAALEKSLGVRLFDRTRSGVEPTGFGRLVLERGNELLAGEADLLREIRLRAGLETGSLVVSAGPHPLEISVVDALARMVAEHPRLSVQATVTHARDVVRNVLSGEVDVGVADRSVATNEKHLLVEPLPTHQIYLACRPGHPLANKSGVTPAEIDAYPLAATQMIGHIAEFVTSTGVKGGRFIPESREYLPAIYVNSFAIARQIARGSDAIASGTARALAADVEAGRLVTLDFHAADLQTGYAIITRKGRTLSPSATKFIALLRAVEAEIVQAESQLPVPRITRSKAVGRGGRHRR
jgi:DNA-binding transcriptional LysR family regulator